MPHVTVTINGKTYRMACDDGQEAHLMSLAERFDTYVNQLRGAFGEIGDQRLTVMAGVMVTDELQELERRISAIEAEISELRVRNGELSSRTAADAAEMARHLGVAADRIEAFARRLAAPSRQG